MAKSPRIRQSVAAAQQDAAVTMAMFRQFMEAWQRGIGFEIVHTGEGKVTDFLTGKIDRLPLMVVAAPVKKDGKQHAGGAK